MRDDGSHEVGTANGEVDRDRGAGARPDYDGATDSQPLEQRRGIGSVRGRRSHRLAAGAGVTAAVVRHDPPDPG
jgi:hypothetical protein